MQKRSLMEEGRDQQEQLANWGLNSLAPEFRRLAQLRVSRVAFRDHTHARAKNTLKYCV